MYEYRVKEITKVVDGDTIYLTADLGFYIDFRVKLRLADIDTPEIFGRADEAEKEKGYKCKEFGEQLLSNHASGGHTLMLQTTGKADKYGRWLGDIWLIGGEYKDAGAESFSNLMKRYVRHLNS